jgi:hypothetical protein
LHGAEDPSAILPCVGSNVCHAPQDGAAVCRLRDQQHCRSASECFSDVCTPFFYDADGDGYRGTPDSYCGTTPPGDFSLVREDHCDSDNRSHPSVTTFSSVPNKCGSFDWNSDGRVEGEGSLGGVASKCGCSTIGTGTVCVRCR